MPQQAKDTLKSLVADPQFRSLSSDGKRKALRKIDPDFSKLSDSGVDQFLSEYSASTGGTVSSKGKLSLGAPPSRSVDTSNNAGSWGNEWPITPKPGESFQQTMERAIAAGRRPSTAMAVAVNAKELRKEALHSLPIVGATLATLPFGGEGGAAAALIGRPVVAFLGGAGGSLLEQKIGQMLKRPEYANPKLTKAFEQGGIQGLFEVLGGLGETFANRFAEKLMGTTTKVAGEDVHLTAGMARPESMEGKLERTLSGTMAGGPLRRTYANAEDFSKAKLADVITNATGYAAHPETLISDVGSAARQIKESASASYKEIGALDPNVETMLAERSELSDSAFAARRAGNMKEAMVLGKQLETQDSMIESVLNSMGGTDTVQKFKNVKALWNQASALEDFKDILSRSVEGQPIAEQITGKGVAQVPQRLPGKRLGSSLSPESLERSYGSLGRLEQAVGKTGNAQTVRQIADLLTRAQHSGDLAGRLVNVGIAMQGTRDLSRGSIEGIKNVAAEMLGLLQISRLMAGNAEERGAVRAFLRVAPNNARALILAHRLATMNQKDSSPYSTGKEAR